MKRKSAYASMNASELARVTRERGLDKPKVITRSEWADFLDADDVKREKQASKVTAKAVEVDADRDTEDATPEDVDSARKTDKPTAPKNTKGKS